MPRVNSDKPFYATLESFLPPEDGQEDYILVKKLPAEFLESSIYDVVQKLLEPEGDNLNDAYNSNEKETAETVKGWFKDAESDPENYRVIVMAIDKDSNEVEVELEGRLNEPQYADIIKVKQETDPETNANESYRLVDLTIQRKLPSGLYDSLDAAVNKLYER